MWTQFWDMHSGGGQKLDWPQIFIEAPEEVAKVVFYNRFGNNPDRVTCTCCGSDYTINTHEDLAQLTAYHRGCAWCWDKATRQGRYFEAGEEIPEHMEESPSYKAYKTLEEYCKDPDVKVIPASEILPEEMVGNVPQQGYVWMD